MNYIDLRSDTVTMPTEEMRRAMMDAVVGDDVYEDDPTVKQLEALAAAATGKEAALFVASGTMGNQVSIMAHTHYGDEIIVGARSHIVTHECGAPARLSGVNFAMADNPNDFIYAADIRRLVRPNDLHCPPTSLVCLENPLSSGDVIPLETLRESYDMAKSLGLAVHLDGARLFNGAVALGVSAKEIADCADSVMFCLSKGLCAPVGSVICGTQEFIERARRMRKIVGGGMRQVGMLAAAGIIALEKMTLRLSVDHKNAKYLAAELNKLPGITADISKVKINIVFWECAIPGFCSRDLVRYLLERGIKINGSDSTEYRYVTNNDVTRNHLDSLIGHMKGYIATIC